MKHNESNKDDQDGGGVPRKITPYSYEKVNTRTWNADDIRELTIELTMISYDTMVSYDTMA